MEINTDFLIRFLNNIAALFGDGCEIVLHDFTKDYDSTIIHIINAIAIFHNFVYYKTKSNYRRRE